MSDKNVNEVVNDVDVQPAPETLSYEQQVVFSDKFVEDVINALGDFSYAETHQVIEFVQNNKNGAPINLVNELLNRLASFPWKVVNGIMGVVNTNQEVYFTLLNNGTSQN